MKPNILNKIKKNPLFKKYNFLILPVISIIFCVVVVIFLLMPSVFKVMEVDKSIAQAKSQSENYNNKVLKLKDIDLATYKSDIATIAKALPYEMDLTSAINILNLLVSLNGLQSENLAFGNPREGEDGLMVIQMNLDLKGNTRQLEGFIKSAQESPRIVKIDSIDVVNSRTSDTIQAAVVVFLYYKEQTAVNLSIDGAVPTKNEELNKLLAKIIKNQSIIPVSPPGSGGSVNRGKPDPFN